MNSAIIFLIGFYFVSLLIGWRLFSLVQLVEVKKHQKIRWVKQISIALLVIIGIASVVWSLWLFHASSDSFFTEVLRYIFAFSWLAMGWYFLPTRDRWLRFVTACSLAGIFLLIAAIFANQFIINVYTAWPLFWLGPVLFRRFKIPLRFFVLFLLLFIAFDFYNISHTVFTENVSGDTTITIDGLVRFGNNFLGASDFVISYLLVAAAEYYFGKKPTLFMVVAFPIFLLALFILSQQSPDGLTLPFTVFIVPIALIEFGVLWRRKKATSRPQGTMSNQETYHR